MIDQSRDPSKPEILAASEVFVAGVDLVLRKTGVCLLRDHSADVCVINSEDLRGGERLAFIRDELVTKVILRKPELIALEGYSYNSEGNTFELGEVGGILKVLAYDAKIPLLIIPPRRLKLFVTGNGSASKTKMIEYVAKFYGVVTDIDDIADATGLAHLARVFLTGDSIRRCELEIIKLIKHPKIKPKKRYKKIRIHV